MYLIVCTLFTSNWLHSMLLLFIFICFYSMIFNSLYFYLFMFLIIELFVYLFGSLEIYWCTFSLHYLPCSLHQVVPPLYRTKQATAFMIETPYENVAVWISLLTQGELPNGSKKPASSRCLGACCKKIHFLFQGSCQKLCTVLPFSTNLAHPFSGNFPFHGILHILSQGVGCFDLAFLFWRNLAPRSSFFKEQRLFGMGGWALSFSRLCVQVHELHTFLKVFDFFLSQVVLHPLVHSLGEVHETLAMVLHGSTSLCFFDDMGLIIKDGPGLHACHRQCPPFPPGQSAASRSCRWWSLPSLAGEWGPIWLRVLFFILLVPTYDKMCTSAARTSLASDLMVLLLSISPFSRVLCPFLEQSMAGSVVEARLCHCFSSSWASWPGKSLCLLFRTFSIQGATGCWFFSNRMVVFFQTRKLGGVFSNQVVAFPKQKSNYKAVGSCLKLWKMMILVCYI